MDQKKLKEAAQTAAGRVTAESPDPDELIAVLDFISSQGLDDVDDWLASLLRGHALGGLILARIFCSPLEVDTAAYCLVLRAMGKVLHAASSEMLALRPDTAAQFGSAGGVSGLLCRIVLSAHLVAQSDDDACRHEIMCLLQLLHKLLLHAGARRAVVEAKYLDCFEEWRSGNNLPEMKAAPLAQQLLDALTNLSLWDAKSRAKGLVSWSALCVLFTPMGGSEKRPCRELAQMLLKTRDGKFIGELAAFLDTAKLQDVLTWCFTLVQLFTYNLPVTTGAALFKPLCRHLPCAAASGGDVCVMLLRVLLEFLKERSFCVLAAANIGTRPRHVCAKLKLDLPQLSPKASTETKKRHQELERVLTEARQEPFTYLPDWLAFLSIEPQTPMVLELARDCLANLTQHVDEKDAVLPTAAMLRLMTAQFSAPKGLAHQVFGKSAEYKAGVWPVAGPMAVVRHCCNPACQKTEAEAGKLKACAACRNVRYCSKACAKAAWKTHKLVCTTKQESGADTVKPSNKG